MKIADVQWQDQNFGLPSSAKAGESFVIQNPETAKNLEVNGKNVSLLKNSAGFFVAGLYDNDPLRIIKTRINKRNIFQNDLVVVQIQFMDIVKTPFSKAAQIRIPASTWQKLNQASDEQKLKDQQTLIAAYEKPEASENASCFQAPLKSKVVSKFASPRELPNGKNYYHSGVDLRGSTGTLVHSMGAGIVVLADHMLVPGNTVLISHGNGIYSRYMHLNKIEVKEGDKISLGQKIGTVGATGRVEAPHLHWEVVWKGSHADPHRFLQAMAPTCDQG